MILVPQHSTSTDTLFPHTTLFLSVGEALVTPTPTPAARHHHGGAVRRQVRQHLLGVGVVHHRAHGHRQRERRRRGPSTLVRPPGDRKSTRLTSSHSCATRMPSSY